MSSQSYVSHCRVLPLGEFTVMIPEPHATLQGVKTSSAILKIVFRHFLFFLMQFWLWRAAAFVSSPIYLFIMICFKPCAWHSMLHFMNVMNFRLHRCCISHQLLLTTVLRLDCWEPQVWWSESGCLPFEKADCLTSSVWSSTVLVEDKELCGDLAHDSQQHVEHSSIVSLIITPELTISGSFSRTSLVSGE